MCMSVAYGGRGYVFVAADTGYFWDYGGGDIRRSKNERRLVRCPRAWVAATGQNGGITDAGLERLERLDEGTPIAIGKMLNDSFLAEESRYRILANQSAEHWASATFHVAACDEQGLWAARLSALGEPVRTSWRRVGEPRGQPRRAFVSWARPFGLSDAYIDDTEDRLRALVADPDIRLRDALRAVAAVFVRTRGETRFMDANLRVGGFVQAKSGPRAFGKLMDAADRVAQMDADALDRWIRETIHPAALPTGSAHPPVRPEAQEAAV